MRLITNLSFVQLQVNGNEMQLSCQALLLESGARIRGFGPSSSWVVFTQWLKCDPFAYELTDTGNGTLLKFEDGTELTLQHQDNERPLDVTDHEDYLDTWTELNKGVRRYYQAPNFPLLSYVPLAYA